MRCKNTIFLLTILLFTNNQAMAQNAIEISLLSYPFLYFLAFDIAFIGALWILAKLAWFVLAGLENISLQKRS